MSGCASPRQAVIQRAGVGRAQVRAILLGTSRPLRFEATADGKRRNTARDFLPNSIVGFGRPELLAGLRLTKARDLPPPPARPPRSILARPPALNFILRPPPAPTPGLPARSSGGTSAWARGDGFPWRGA